jgi:hypothetical protein
MNQGVFFAIIILACISSCKNKSNNQRNLYINLIESAAQAKTLEAKYRFTENHQGAKFTYESECLGLKEDKITNYYIKQIFDDSIVSENFTVTVKGEQSTLLCYPKTYPCDELNAQDLINIDFVDYKLLRYLFEDKELIKRQKNENIVYEPNKLIVNDSAFTRTFTFNSKNELVQIINTNLKSDKTHIIDILSLNIEQRYNLEKERWMIEKNEVIALLKAKL